AMGDALAMALLERRGLTPDDFARFHPGGHIGRKVVTVAHVMHAGSDAPLVPIGTSMRDAIKTMSDRKLGMACVVREDGTLAGVITDGDLRRHLGRGENLLSMTVDAVMSRGPVTIGRQELAVAALTVLEARKITSLVVIAARERGE